MNRRPKTIQVRYGECIYQGETFGWSSRTTIPDRTLADDEIVIGTMNCVRANEEPGWVRVEQAVYEKVVRESEVTIESEAAIEILVRVSDA